MKIPESIDTRLRSAFKSISMGDYISPLLETSPLKYDVNHTGKGVAFTNCNVFDGISPELKNNMTVLVEGDRISQLCRSGQADIPGNFHIYDAQGQTIMPGLIDNHVHECSPFTYDMTLPAVRQMHLQIAKNNMRTVYSGFTTVCDMGGPQGIIKEFTKFSDLNKIPGPRYLNSFTLISPKKGRKLGYPPQVEHLNPFKAWLLEGQVATRPETLAELKRCCYKVKDDGGAHLKTTYQSYPFSRIKADQLPIFEADWMKAIFKAGKDTGLVVDIHMPYSADVEKCVDLAIEAGARIRVQHMTFDADLKPELIQKMSDYGFYIIPTVMVFGDAFHLQALLAWLQEGPQAHMMPEANSQLISRIRQLIDLEPYSGCTVIEVDTSYFRDQFEIVRRNTQKAHDAGIIGFGTDCGGTYTGFFGRASSEIAYYEEFGIPASDILKYLTSKNAELSGLKDRGVVQTGKLADLIAVKGNPLADVSVLDSVGMVMKGGVFLKYKDRELTSLLNNCRVPSLMENPGNSFRRSRSAQWS
jgi:imidazolonepropionase-like amidohydrolase